MNGCLYNCLHINFNSYNISHCSPTNTTTVLIISVRKMVHLLKLKQDLNLKISCFFSKSSYMQIADRKRGWYTIFVHFEEKECKVIKTERCLLKRCSRSLHCCDGREVPFVFTHTHTRLTALCPGLPGWASTRKVNQSGFYCLY